mgnify:CR=1 FL=1
MSLKDGLKAFGDFIVLGPDPYSSNFVDPDTINQSDSTLLVKMLKYEAIESVCGHWSRETDGDLPSNLTSNQSNAQAIVTKCRVFSLAQILNWPMSKKFCQFIKELLYKAGQDFLGIQY